MTTLILEDLTSTRLYKNDDIIKSKKNWEQLITNDSKLQGGGWVGAGIKVPFNGDHAQSEVWPQTRGRRGPLSWLRQSGRERPLPSSTRALFHSVGWRNSSQHTRTHTHTLTHAHTCTHRGHRCTHTQAHSGLRLNYTSGHLVTHTSPHTR